MGVGVAPNLTLGRATCRGGWRGLAKGCGTVVLDLSLVGGHNTVAGMRQK